DTARPVTGLVSVDLGHDQRDVGVQAESAGVVDGHGAACGGDRGPLLRDLVWHVEHGHVDAVEDLGGQGLHGDVLSAHAQDLAGAARGGDQADLTPHVRALGEDAAHDGADGAGRADDGKGGKTV